jgi:hypothetical protein
VEFCFSLMMPLIEDSHGLAGVDFTDMSFPSMVHDNGFQERRAQSKYGDQTVVIGGMHHQHDGSSMGLAWDPGIVVVDSSVADIDGMASLCSPEFTLGVRMIGCLEERSSEELTEPQQFMIVWLIRDSLEGSYMSTRQIIAMSRGCFAPHRVVWDPSYFTTYEQVRESFCMEGLHRHCVMTYGGVFDLAAEQVVAHSSGRVDTALAHSWRRMGKHVERLHHRLIEGAEHVNCLLGKGCSNFKPACIGLTPSISDYLQTIWSGSGGPPTN